MAKRKPKAAPALSEQPADDVAATVDDGVDGGVDGGVDDGVDDGAAADLASAAEADVATTEPEVAEAVSDDTAADHADRRPPELVLVPDDADLAPTDDSEDSGDEEAPAGQAAVPTERNHLKQVIESLVFVSDRPISPATLARHVKAKPGDVQALLDELVTEYRGRGVELVEAGGGYQFRSAPATAPFVRDLVSHRPVRLTRAQLETLALVSYRQPITRPEIDDVRGVDSGSAIKVLLDRGLLKLLGRKDEAGRPLLYGTTPFFLEFFGLKALKDLPTLREFSDLSDESRELFKRKLGEPPPSGALAGLDRAGDPTDSDPLTSESDAEADDTMAELQAEQTDELDGRIATADEEADRDTDDEDDLDDDLDDDGDDDDDLDDDGDDDGDDDDDLDDDEDDDDDDDEDDDDDDDLDDEDDDDDGLDDDEDDDDDDEDDDDDDDLDDDDEDDDKD